MGLLAKAKNAIVAALDQNRFNDGNELKYLRETYERANPNNIRRNQWYRLVNPNNDVVGFSYSCVCGIEYQLLHVFDWLGRKQTCPTCKTDFDLLKSCGITKEIAFSKWSEKFAALPIRPRLLGTQPSGPRIIDTWLGDGGGVDYEHSDPAAAVAWK